MIIIRHFMLNINVTTFENNGKTFYFLKYSLPLKAKGIAYSINNAGEMIRDLKNNLQSEIRENIEDIVLTSRIDNTGHHEYNILGLSEIKKLLESNFPDSVVRYSIRHTKDFIK